MRNANNGAVIVSLMLPTMKLPSKKGNEEELLSLIAYSQL